MSLFDQAAHDLFQMSFAYTLRRLIAAGVLTRDDAVDDIQAAAAALLAAEPGDLIGPRDLPDALRDEYKGAVQDAMDILAAVATTVVEGGAPPPAPPPPDVPTVAGLVGAVFPPHMRIEVSRGGAPLGRLTLLPHGWRWRSLAPGDETLLHGLATAYDAAIAGGAADDDAVDLQYPEVGG